jgi:hypothetical protein
MSYDQTQVNGNTLRQVFREIRAAYGDSPTKELALEIVKVLLKNGDFSGPEYRFMCWLKFMDIFSLDGIMLPKVLSKDEIPVVPIQEFEDEFSYSDQRKTLLKNLIETVQSLRSLKNINEPINVIVGGSYVDSGNDRPNDIDCIFLIPENVWQRNPIAYMEDILRQSPRLDGTVIDFKTLPDNFSLSNFKGYNDICLLANNTKIRDNGTRMVTNEFVPRRVVSVSL